MLNDEIEKKIKIIKGEKTTEWTRINMSNPQPGSWDRDKLVKIYQLKK
jgi:hypothetical protein